MNLEVNGSIYDLWSAIYTQEGATLQASGVNWNHTIDPNQIAEFGYCANKTLETLEQSQSLSTQVEESLATATTQTRSATITPSILRVQRIVQSDWTTGYCEDVIITNSSSSDEVWQVALDFEGEIYTIWNTDNTVDGQSLSASEVDWNRIVKAESETSFGFCANR